MRSVDLDPALLALSAAQGGVFTVAQALAHGYTGHELRRLLRSRPPVLTAVRRGVYALTVEYVGVPVHESHRIRVAALGLRLAAPAVLTHQSAAMEHGLELLDADLSSLHVTREGGTGARKEAGVHHHVAELPERDVVRRHGALDLATPARAAVDVARDSTRLECAVAVFDSVLRSGVPRDELEDVAARSRSWPGARFVARALAMADGRAANPGESWSRVVLVRSGVAPLDLQVPVCDEGGLIGYADFGWDGVLGEFDGKGKYGLDVHTDPEEAARIVWREKRREDRLRQTHEVVRWGVADLHRPARLAARIRAAQARAQQRRGRSG